MKRCGPIVLLLLACLAPDLAPALEFLHVDRFALAAGQTCTGETWVSARTVDLQGACADDLLVAATTLSASGTLNRDWWAAATDTVTFSGRVGGRARLAALQMLALDGVFENSLLAAANTVRLGTGCVVRGDAALAGESVISQGEVGGNLSVTAVRATVGGVVRGSVRLIGNDLVVMPGTEIRGDLLYTSSRELFLDGSVRLGGQIRRVAAPA